MKQKNTIFLTGATGLVGSYLLKILLQNGHKVYALSRSKDGKSAKQRVADILNFWDKKVYLRYSKNLKVIQGNIIKRDLGLNKRAKTVLKNSVEEIFHSAAVTDINWPLNKIRKVNVVGTKNVLNFSLKCKKLKKVNHISTAYVCGNYKGVFTENDLDVGQSFNSTYEQSKFEAEKLVKQYRKALWIDIFRPAIVIGESKTGRIMQFRNIYQFLHLFCLEIFDSFPISEGIISAVTVDDTAKATYLISQKTKARNGNYHIFPSRSLPIQFLIKSASEYLKFKQPKTISFENFLTNLTPVQMEILKRNILSLNISVKLDSHLTEFILSNSSFKFHKLDKKNLIPILKFFRK